MARVVKMEVVMVWSMLIWNEPSLGDVQRDRLAVSTTDNLFLSEDECRLNARSLIERQPRYRIACVGTQLAKAEFEKMKQYEKFVEDSLQQTPLEPRP
jgi:hypothetical protein